ncbi:hypothetical protein Sta7437_4722 (plasmid) [Stanieria cyanosphaera PCC 7437]|uniref:WCX domain-containing protein n=1 Tax=Stanieria cyanosphaera (strain ATCC 29371 / PCC 7437) TaxID=111780 RepID=K9Y194_STAC7|nr:WYL domain-containing protein [Stanieria cyanosphaera]AFZ38166.1 hypothetical protein Sta7437_4722 [Stanieria cyanosphaera PCC 7437]
MSEPVLCHCLIGIPGSGKSTVAKHLSKLIPNAVIVSSDLIRFQVYGDENTQGDWQLINQRASVQIRAAIADGIPVIYDATNAKRAWRMSFLMQLQDVNAEWLGWWLKIPVAKCQQWNKQRERRVPNEIIKTFNTNLQKFPPITAEGFVAINEIKYHQNKLILETIPAQIDNLTRRRINSKNRVKNYELHQYSRLLDFDRLMHLIALILRYPGVGNLQQSAPQVLENILGKVPIFTSSVAEISALMSKISGEIYSDRVALERDLFWLETNEILTLNYTCKELELTSLDAPALITHAYSDREPFTRLIETIRFILHNPLLFNPESGSLPTLVSQLKARGLVHGKCQSIIRKDIEIVLKPYQILPEGQMKKGYFAGNAVFSNYELKTIFDRLIIPNLKHIEDPVYLDIYQKLKNKIDASKLYENSEKSYPVRAMKDTSIVDTNKLIKLSNLPLLYKNLEILEDAIATGKLLKLNSIQGSAFFADNVRGSFEAYPIQLVFHDIAWYLGFEYAPKEKNAGLLKFERLDRLTLEGVFEARSQSQQLKSLHNLIELYRATPSLFIGKTVEQQQKFLNTDKQQDSDIKTTVKLWFKDEIFRFIAEGTKRYPASNMKMSPPKERESFYKISFGQIFTLKSSDDPNFPNRLHLKLPQWSLEDVYLKRWILGFDGDVKVVAPPELVRQIKNCGEAISNNY